MTARLPPPSRTLPRLPLGVVGLGRSATPLYLQSRSDRSGADPRHALLALGLTLPLRGVVCCMAHV